MKRLGPIGRQNTMGLKRIRIVGNPMQSDQRLPINCQEDNMNQMAPHQASPFRQTVVCASTWFTFACLLLAGSIVWADQLNQTDWPAFRGVGATGLANGFATADGWDVTNPDDASVLWKSSIPGLGHSCPCLLYTSPSPRDRTRSRMPSSA